MRQWLLKHYPVEAEPDGDILLPHHYWIGIILMIGGFCYWQPQHDPLAGGVIAGVGLAVALDDFLSHFFGVWTPLDWLFKRAMRNDRVRQAYGRLLALLGRR